MKHTTRVVLAGRHKLITDGLRALFESKADYRVVAQVDDGPAAIDLIGRVKPDVVVLDLLVQALDSLAPIGQIRKQAPATKIVTLSMSTEESYVSQALSDGASAYVLKSGDFDHLARAIREALAGRQYLSPPLDHRAIKEFQRKAGGEHFEKFGTLTSRERQVLKLAVQGRTSSQIATRLGISPRTAETHRANIYRKLQIQNHADLVALALRRGLITRDL
jgi:DNA-binding NarL/FixJ family response regulator